jgi:type II secretory pathway component GspD/PulD (secretin)
MQFTNEDEWEDIKGRALREDPEKRLEENREHTERLKLAPSPSQKPIPQEMKMKLEEKLSIEFIDTPLRDVISFLQEKSKMNFFLDKDAPDANVNIKLNDVPLSVILEYILPKSLGYVVKDNIVHITVEPLELRVYDVRDLLINLEDRQSLTTQAETTLSEEETTSAGEGKDTFDRVKEIIDLITSTIEPASWSVNEGKGLIAAREGMLGDIVITHVLDVHEQVENLLAALRSSADIQVSIEARFIAVSNNFLEAFGNNINELDLTQGADDPKRRGIFTEAGDTFIDTGTTNALGATTGLNLTYQIFDGLLLKGFLKAVQESDEAETVTAPKITLSNTQRGTIKVVTTTSYIESFTIVSQTPQPVMAEIDDGTTFSVRPIVSADRRYVYLEVHPVITSVTFTETDFQTVGQTLDAASPTVATNKIQRPTTVKQELSVTVCVPDKGILMIGGLGKSSLTKTSKGVPILSKIPIVKRLFSSDVVDRDITTAGNLIILIKPTILIREEEEARAFAKEKREVDVRFPTYGR